jgi:hypothetical protein
MGNKERLEGILERQAAAAEQERLDEAEASAKAEKVRSVRFEVIQKWQQQRAHLEIAPPLIADSWAIRAARGLLDWTVRDLAERAVEYAGVELTTRGVRLRTK